MVIKVDQKSVEWNVNAMLKFCKAGEPVLATCPGTVATSKPCFWLPEHHRFVVCKNESAYLHVGLRLWRGPTQSLF